MEAIKFRRQLASLGLVSRPIKDDGNCLFRSISDFIDGDEELMHEDYRNFAVEYMRKYGRHFSKFLTDTEASQFDEYLDRMSILGIYAGHLELRALSSVLNVQFIIHEYNQDPLLVRDREDRADDSKTIHLAYYPAILHYESARLQGDKERKPSKKIIFDLNLTSERKNLNRIKGNKQTNAHSKQQLFKEIANEQSHSSKKLMPNNKKPKDISNSIEKSGPKTRSMSQSNPSRSSKPSPWKLL